MFGTPPERGYHLAVDADRRTVREYGGDPVPVTVIEDAEGDYYGWIATGQDAPVMIQPSPALFSMQFPYGPKAEVEAGRGKIVRLRVDV